MRTTVLMIFISFTLMTGCTSASDTEATPESSPVPAAAAKPARVIALEGVYFDMPLEEFKPLFKIKKEKKKGKDFNVALDTDTLIYFALDSYMGQRVQGASATFYSGRLALLSIKIQKPGLSFFQQAFKEQYGKPKEVRLPGTNKRAQDVWNLKDGEIIRIYLARKDGPLLEYGSSSYADKYALRLKKLLKAEAKKILNKPAYTAVLTCSIQNSPISLVACLSHSNLKVRSGKKSKVYTPFDLARVRRKNISLKESFQIQARNSSSNPYMMLNIVIRNRLKQVAYQDSVSPGRWINVGN